MKKEAVVFKKPIRYDVSQLPGMLPVRQGGRFAALKVDIQREIATTPPGQFFILPAPTAPTEKERLALANALRDMLIRLGWAMKWTPVNNSYIVARKGDFAPEAQAGQHRRSGALHRIRTMIATLPTTFTVDELKRAMGNEAPVHIYSAVKQMAKTKELRHVSYGTYKKESAHAAA